MKNLRVIILGGGKNKRMQLSFPKVLFPIWGKVIIEYVLDSVFSLRPESVMVVVGYQGEKVKVHLSKSKYSLHLQFAHQVEQKGTADAVLAAKKKLSNFKGEILILYGDMPIISPSTLKAMLRHYQRTKPGATILTTEIPGPRGYGRIARDKEGNIIKIIEEKDATPQEKDLSEINVGAYLISAEKLFKHLKKINNYNVQKEYYLTDIVSVLTSAGEKVNSVSLENSEEILGVNTKDEIINISQIIKKNILTKHIENGVFIKDANTTFIDSTVKIKSGTTIYPFTIIEGKTVIGKDAVIGPSTTIINSTVGNLTSVMQSYLEESTTGNNCKVGPFSRIRPGSIIADKARIGNFVEIKKSKIGKSSQINHLSYIGDAEIGENTNIGAGTITCNYDGKSKHQTIIGNNSFVGSNSILVAPIKIGNFSYTAAGSTITKNIPDYALGVGRERQINIENWGRKKNEK